MRNKLDRKPSLSDSILTDPSSKVAPKTSLSEPFSEKKTYSLTSSQGDGFIQKKLEIKKLR